ncbi:CCA tRNA nucleotidyltransferase [Lacticaseibacillus sharpeae]|uniref:CCA-adding enzyme n=1 Tax=Lacticaseibacillus sharpeae JCM 1186 = DSM 20505 TaxID=1291052 RepID=A0A0R1ZW15_9LACO|nr:CCA tRNA nucleotidyltransferase [Lacticaseibacillus sharpeae]KRM55993.1 tRNA nucleotidyltransferase poly(A) polymerase [Lacticaseibacillus sharpeae JCM 1186 = DSM 20505]
MHVDLTHPEFQAAIPILQKIEAAGFEAYFVGGCVRDALLGLPIHDVDIATSAYPQEVKAIFRRTVDTGIQHGTVMVLDHGTGYEVTTFRTESTYQDFRRPDAVTFVRSLKEDQLRRDFTINALAARHDGLIIDNFNGLADLDAHLLRAVGNAQDRFHEDALRMMRAVRFESQLGFTLEAATAQALADNASLLQHIAVERIATEFTRLLLGINRAAGLSSMLQAGLYTYCPLLVGHKAELSRLQALDSRQIKHEDVAWTLLTAVLGVKPVAFMKAWKQPNDLTGTVDHAVKLLPALLTGTADNLALFNAGAASVSAAIGAASYLQPGFAAAAWQARYQALPMHTAKDLALTGQMLLDAGMQPGPQLGRALAQARTAVISGQLPNDAAALLAAVK